jgi:hypothetical protein
MVRKVLFIMTHVGSGWEELVEALERNPRVHCFNTGRAYHHPDDVRLLTQMPHRKETSASIWADVIFHNKDFTMKRLAQHYNFVFWSKPFDEIKFDLINKHGYGPKQAEAYYACRLEGMRQYWNRHPEMPWNPDLEGNAVLDTILG